MHIAGVVIKPKTKVKFDEKAIKAKVKKALDDTAKHADPLFAQIFSTWGSSETYTNFKGKQEHYQRTHDTVVHKAFKMSGNDATEDVWNEDQIFFYLNGGTSVKHVVMRSGWSPKTSVGSYKSKSGSGMSSPRITSNRINAPGIEARGWTKMMAIDLQPILLMNINKEFGKTVAKYSF